MATLAPSLQVFRAEVNRRWPQRDHASDGWIGDAAHQDRPSDHNPGARGLVHAFDTDEDLDGNTADSGRDAWAIAEGLRVARDARIKYVIYDGRMFSSYAKGVYPAWQWRPYSGVNKHLKHVHLSILSTIAAEQNLDPWLTRAPNPTAPPKGTVTVNLRILRRNMTGGDVKSLQLLLRGKAGQAAVVIDGQFGVRTETAVRNVQRQFGLEPNGIVDDKTWGALFV